MSEAVPLLRGVRGVFNIKLFYFYNQPTMKQILLLLFLCLSANAQEKFTVYFNLDIAETNDPSGEKLSDWIAKNPGAKIQKIYGYTDRQGDEAYNQDLSEKRVKYVYEQLKTANINVENVEQKGFGESESTALNNARDRKVVIYFSKDLTKQVSTAKVGDKIRLDNVNFHKNSDVVLDSSKPVMDELLKIMKANPKLKIQIQGHVCCMPETTAKISEKRAKTVYNFLVKNGINKNRLSFTSFGSTRPVYPIPEQTEEERIANRRVEIEIVAN
jgi:outer membrane protein OmpA-like peptidoglycan-associated protein